MSMSSLEENYQHEKCCEEGGSWFTKDGRGAHGVGLWKEINKGAVLKQFSNFSVGDGKRMSFWEDNWCGPEPLSVTFPEIYTKAAAKGSFLADFWD